MLLFPNTELEFSLRIRDLFFETITWINTDKHTILFMDMFIGEESKGFQKSLEEKNPPQYLKDIIESIYQLVERDDYELEGIVLDLFVALSNAPNSTFEKFKHDIEALKAKIKIKNEKNKL